MPNMIVPHIPPCNQGYGPPYPNLHMHSFFQLPQITRSLHSNRCQPSPAQIPRTTSTQLQEQERRRHVEALTDAQGADQRDTREARHATGTAQHPQDVLTDRRVSSSQERRPTGVGDDISSDDDDNELAVVPCRALPFHAVAAQAATRAPSH